MSTWLDTPNLTRHSLGKVISDTDLNFQGDPKLGDTANALGKTGPLWVFKPFPLSTKVGEVQSKT